MNKKITKRALYLSFVSMFLCFTMLLGTTYAWFTDTVTSGVNQIVAGNLDVELYHTNKNVTDAEVDTATKLFELEDGQLWEPGAMVYEKFTIKNEGNLALKYLFSLETSNCKPANFADALKVAIVEDEAFVYNRENVKNITSWKSLESFELTGELNNKVTPAVTAKSFGVVIYWMPSDNDNDFNMNNGKTGEVSVDILVNLFATQLEAENDSFGPDYDANAAFGTYIELEAGADLLAAMASAEADKPLTIMLNGNVEWPTEGHIGENNITDATAITIIGNGNTITATGAGVTPLGDVEAPMTLKDVKIVDNSVSYKESAWEFTYLEMGGTKLVCENVTFADEIQIGTNATFTNCSFESNEESVYAVWVEDGSASFTNCTFTGYRGMKVHEEYGTEVSSVIVKDCTFSDITKKPGIALGNIYMNGATYITGGTTYTNTTDTTVSITGNTFINCQAGDQSKYIYETDTDVNTFNFVEENNTVLNNATVVETKDQFLALSAKALTGNNGTAEEAVIVIGADIDMQGAEFSAMIAQRGDKLTIVGNGHKISNVKVVSGANDNTTGQASMFYAYPNSTLTVSDLILEDITVTADANGTGYAAAVVGYCEGTAVLDNVDVVGATVTGVKSSGMLVGHLSGSLTATDCDITGTVTLADFAEETAGHYAGKYLGTMAGAVTLNNCTANVTVSGNLNAANIGEIYGRKVSGSSNVEYAAGQTALNAAIASGAKTIELAAGTYTFPTEELSEDVVLNCNSGTVFEGTSALDINGATVIGATFSNDTGNVAASSIEGTFKDCTFTGYNVLSTGTTDGDVTFENCTIEGDNYGIHFDSGNGENNIVFKNCKITGFTTFAASIESVVFEDCEFINETTDPSKATQVNIWGGEATFKNCHFDEFFWMIFVPDNATVNIDNVTYDGDINDFFYQKSSATVTWNFVGTEYTVKKS